MSNNKLPFIIGKQYSRNDLYEILNIHDTKGGNWSTGYTKYKDTFYIFINLETSGRTGHNYNDRWLSDGTLDWRAKANTKLNQPTINEMISNKYPCCFFIRTDNRNVHFTYHGIGKAIRVYESTPVEIIWDFSENDIHSINQSLFALGHFPGITNKHRIICLNHYGTSCYVCNMNFQEKYGYCGEGFIDVAFLNPDNRERDVIDPIIDLRPICPNCAAMLLRRPVSSMTMDELKEQISKGNKTRKRNPSTDNKRQDEKCGGVEHVEFQKNVSFRLE